jgi:hypothetical protein
VLLCQELPDTRPQDGATVRAAAVGRPAATFQLHFPASTVDDGLKHGNCATVAVSVAGSEWALLVIFGAEDRKCVPTRPTDVAHRRRNLRDVAGEHADEVGQLRHAVGEAKFAEKRFAVRDVLGVFDRRGIDGDIVAREDLSRRVVDSVCFRVRIAVESVHERVVCQLCKVVERRHGWGGFLGQSIWHRGTSKNTGEEKAITSVLLMPLVASPNSGGSTAVGSTECMDRGREKELNHPVATRPGATSTPREIRKAGSSASISTKMNSSVSTPSMSIIRECRLMNCTVLNIDVAKKKPHSLKNGASSLFNFVQNRHAATSFPSA